MIFDIEQYTGSVVEIIYIDKHQIVSKRKIKVCSVTELFIRAYCYAVKAPRVFKRQNILNIESGKWSA